LAVDVGSSVVTPNLSLQPLVAVGLQFKMKLVRSHPGL